MGDSIESQNGFKLDNPTVQQFFRDRSALMGKENELRSDYEFRQCLSPTAKRADEIVSRIRLQEHETIWSTSPSLPGEESKELFPGMIFNSAKPHLESTKLFRIIKAMPKGTILHCHFGAMVDLNWVFEKAIETPGMCISSDVGPLDTSQSREAGGNFRIEFRKQPDVDAESIWSSNYKLGSQIPLKEAVHQFPEYLDEITGRLETGKTAFLTWIVGRCSITQSDAISHHLGVDDIWRKLNMAFKTLATIIFYEPISRPFLRQILKTCMEDGIKWLEMRAILGGCRLEGEEEPEKDPLVLAKIMNEVFEEFMREESEGGKKFWGVRLIWAYFRSRPAEDVVADMKDCIRVKKLYPHLISGYDLVGPEDDGRTLHSLTPELLWFRQQCALEKVNIPFFFHAGECLGHGDSTDNNLYDAILLGSRRLGHAFSLYKHPHLISVVKEKQILVESCPISNEVLRYAASILSHPLPALLAQGVKASLSNDDPALMGQGTSGMSHDFWQAVQGWENLGLAGLGALAQNSVRWAAFEDQTEEEWHDDIHNALKGTSSRAKRVQEWNTEWEVFCKWVVEEFRG